MEAFKPSRHTLVLRAELAEVHAVRRSSLVDDLQGFLEGAANTRKLGRSVRPATPKSLSIRGSGLAAPSQPPSPSRSNTSCSRAITAPFMNVTAPKSKRTDDAVAKQGWISRARSSSCCGRTHRPKATKQIPLRISALDVEVTCFASGGGPRSKYPITKSCCSGKRGAEQPSIPDGANPAVFGK